MTSSGHVGSIHTANGTTINHSAHGGRTVVSEHTNARGEHIRTVSMGRGRGYSDHAYMRGGHPYMRRTYYDHGHYYARGYRGYYYHGNPYYGYNPGFYYGAGFYGWAYNPWASPIAFGWGWGGAPWYGAYGYYFNPYPFYASPSFWLTDYIISQNLQAAYAAQADAAAQANANAQAQVPADYQSGGGDQASSGGSGGSAPVTLTPEVKQAIADEVKAEIAAEKDAAATPNPPEPTGDVVPAALDPAHRTFIVSAGLSETVADGTECSLSQGDVLTRIDDNPDANQNVKVLVSSSQKNDCAAGAQVSVAVNDLQDMHNAFREKIDDGLKTLADNQGKNGMPASPSTATTAVPGAQVSPDMDAAADMQKQQQDADAAEKEVAQANSSGGGN
jgi:hypothetical protein